jgi:transcriptional regulator with XRE-family HTH domain
VSARCYPDSVYPDQVFLSDHPVAGTGKGSTPRQREFGDRVRSRRQALGISQEELAHRAGINRTYIGSLESGERNPSLDNIARLARGLGCDAAELVAGLQELAGRRDLPPRRRARRREGS